MSGRGGGGGGGMSQMNPSSQTAHEIRGKQKRATGGGLQYRPRKPRKPGRSGVQETPVSYQTMLSRQALMILMK